MIPTMPKAIEAKATILRTKSVASSGTRWDHAYLMPCIVASERAPETADTTPGEKFSANAGVPMDCIKSASRASLRPASSAAVGTSLAIHSLVVLVSIVVYTAAPTE